MVPLTGLLARIARGNTLPRAALAGSDVSARDAIDAASAGFPGEIIAPENSQQAASASGQSASPSISPVQSDLPDASGISNGQPEPARRRGSRRSRYRVWLSLLGPGIISAAAGNDAGGIATYSQVGAQYGLHLLWALTIVTVGLVVVQEMCSRMGAVTGKGLAGLIRENFGVKITLFAMIALVIANLALTVSEFAGIAAVGEMFLGAASRFYVVPIAAVIVWLLVSRGSYVRVERVFIVASLIFATYIFTGLKVGVPWAHVAQAAFVPRLGALHWNQVLIVSIVTVIGTTISPYMQFYQQAATRDKGISVRNYTFAKWDTIIGCVASILVAAFIMIVCAQTLYASGHHDINTAADAALALKPLAGKFAQILFAFGLLNASLMAAVVVPLSTAYAVTESLGWESGFGKKVSELPLFYGTYGILILLGALLVVLAPPTSNLIQLILNAQTINCALLPVELILILILVNRRRIMGEYRNSVAGNIVGWVTAVIAGGLSLFLLAYNIWSAIGHKGN